MPGDAISTNSHERGHLDIKSENYFNFAEGIGNVLLRMPIIGMNMFANMGSLATVPDIGPDIWKRAQRLVEKDRSALCYKLQIGTDEYLIVPSENLIKEHVPDSCKTADEKRAHIKVWAKEFSQMLKKGSKYSKFHNGEWDFDIGADMMFSFWLLHEVPTKHPHRQALFENGIAYRCSCNNFTHYHVCKHSVALGMIKKGIKVPTRFSAKPMGKRKAPAGASLRKRSRALEIDN